MGSSLDLSALDGSTGFRLDAVSTWDRLGRAVSEAGDVNGDGIDDLLIGAWGGSTGYAGESFVVFGKASGWAASLDLSTLDGTTGFRLDGVAAADYSGKAVGAAGDVNGDGFDDILIGAYKAASAAGHSYVVFGQASGWAASLDLSDLDGTTGFRIDGIDGSDRSGRSVSGAGDVNGDGFDDMLVGAPHADPSSNSNSGQAFVIYGGNFTNEVTHLGTSNADSLSGTNLANVLVGGGGGDSLVGNGGADVIRGGSGGDELKVSDLTFLRLDGGSGLDTLVLDAEGHDLDLTTTPNTKITSIEMIDINGTGANTITLNLGDVLDISDSVTNLGPPYRTQLLIAGGSDDTVKSTGQGWQPGSQAPVDGQTYDTFTSGHAMLFVHEDMIQDIN